MKYLVLNQIVNMGEQKCIKQCAEMFDIKLQKQYVLSGYFGSKCLIITEEQCIQLNTLLLDGKIPYKYREVLSSALTKLYQTFCTTTQTLPTKEIDNGN